MSLDIGQSAGYINAITSGRAYPSMDAFYNICEYLHITPYEFFRPEQEPPTISTGLYNELTRLSDNDFKALLELSRRLEAHDIQNIIAFIDRISGEKQK
jgi:transcriptional regulator with XRE-family HTH domain